MTNDRRKQGRVPALIEVIWKGASGRYESRTGDLNLGGCFVDTIAQVEIGEIVQFKLRLPSEEWIEVQGEVVYSYPNTGFGVRFTNMTDSDRKRLEWLIKAEAHKSERY
ncbi:MAG: PilZ domain-containing protein [Pyrinomonadaceae bacterium]